MISTGMQAALNTQVKYEIESAYLYLAMSAYCENINLPGMAAWLRVQWQEELAHAMKLFQYMNERDGRILLEAISKPPSDYDSPSAIFTQVLAHEKKVTAAINALYDVAIKEKDLPTQIELQWFVKEQVEEEKSAQDILNMIQIAGESGVSLLMLDRQLGQRAGGK